MMHIVVDTIQQTLKNTRVTPLTLFIVLCGKESLWFIVIRMKKY